MTVLTDLFSETRGTQVTNFILGSLLLCSHHEFQFFSSHWLIIILPFPLVKTREVCCSDQLENNGIVVL